jgi:hypothetical protein
MRRPTCQSRRRRSLSRDGEACAASAARSFQGARLLISTVPYMSPAVEAFWPRSWSARYLRCGVWCRIEYNCRSRLPTKGCSVFRKTVSIHATRHTPARTHTARRFTQVTQRRGRRAHTRHYSGDRTHAPHTSVGPRTGGCSDITCLEGSHYRSLKVESNHKDGCPNWSPIGAIERIFKCASFWFLDVRMTTSKRLGT